jgi:hypothetical protein
MLYGKKCVFYDLDLHKHVVSIRIMVYTSYNSINRLDLQLNNTDVMRQFLWTIEKHLNDNFYGLDLWTRMEENIVFVYFF